MTVHGAGTTHRHAAKCVPCTPRACLAACAPGHAAIRPWPCALGCMRPWPGRQRPCWSKPSCACAAHLSLATLLYLVQVRPHVPEHLLRVSILSLGPVAEKEVHLRGRFGSAGPTGGEEGQGLS
eukprot:364537-Chlamydomonas_euryale.AAC.5